MRFTTRVRYSDTDQMKIAHHSNYIRWFEDARLAYLIEKECPLETLEELGYYVPVISVSAEYKSPLFFPNTITIAVKCEQTSGIRFSFFYGVYKGEQVVATGVSEHTVTDQNYKALRFKKWPEKLTTLFSEDF